ncbi:acyl-CoA dehydrogenase family protein [Tomitella biformata]|uniref:acyl-CoA dehydrogenase family protein n=1 Tax=Tomitella biformata TaxID=630403 RepID=UPI000467E5BA|nr:acyl-CoA dehydrogenase family protein [Tomitella biformata]
MSLDIDTRKVVAASLREVFARRAAAGEADARSLSAALDDLGWDEVAAAEPADATTMLFTEQGRSLTCSRLLDQVLLAELTELLPPPDGPRAVLYPVSGATGLPGQPRDGVLLGGLDAIAQVVTPSADGVWLLVLPAAALATTPVRGFDSGTTWLAAAPDPALATATVPAGDGWCRALAAGRRAAAAEIIGVCQGALDIAVAHTSAREQYGRPLASFQAVRHQLAESHAAIESARVTLAAAWAAAADPSRVADPGWAAALAKQRAGHAQALVTSRTVQVLGAMGLTLENDMHRHVTRAAALDLLLGGHAELGETLGAALLAGADPLPVADI